MITEDQADNVLVADVIIRARRTADRRYVNCVFEISRTIGRNDIQRAYERAAMVAVATGEETIAVVIGQVIQPPQQRQAETLNVRTIIPEMFRDAEAQP